MDAPREQQIADALEALLPAVGHGDPAALRSVRRLLGVIAGRGPEGLREDAARFAKAQDRALKDGAAAMARQLRGRRAGASPAPVLIVEDDELVSAAIGLHLMPLGREIREVRNLRAAEKALAEPVSAVVLDLQLPGGEDGRDLLASRSGSIPFVVLSAYAGDAAVQRECRALGARAVLPKPVHPQALLEALQAVLVQPASPDDAHVVALLRQRTHLTARDLAALEVGISDLTWDAAVRTHLAGCDECRERQRRRQSTD